MPYKAEKPFLSKNIVLLLGLIFLLAIISGGIAIFFYSNTFNGDISADHSKWGSLGDFFGGVLNPIFSLLALFALLLTIILQNKELSLSTIEFSKSAEALTEQSKSIKIQNFENTFFNLMSLHNDIVNSLEFENLHKRACFKGYIDKLELSAINKSVDDHSKGIPANISYDLGYKSIAYSVEHYHKNLYQIIAFVKNNAVGLDQKKYTNFMRAQLSRDELHLLFLHGISKYGVKKFKKLIEQYELLEHLPEDTFLLKENMYFYDKSAFGKNDALLKLYEKSTPHKNG